jgi:hypothetical protein
MNQPNPSFEVSYSFNRCDCVNFLGHSKSYNQLLHLHLHRHRIQFLFIIFFKNLPREG